MTDDIITVLTVVTLPAEKYGEADVHQDLTVDFSHSVKTILLRLGCGPLSQIRRLLSGKPSLLSPSLAPSLIIGICPSLFCLKLLQFPWVLDMAPYTAEGIQERERNDNSGITEPVSTTATTKNRNSLTLTNPRLSPSNYELVGVVVHSGQASAGHYYSFIKDRKRGGGGGGGGGSTSALDGSSKSRWFKFNDTSVEEFEMTDSTLEAECFGGTYKAKSYDSSNNPIRIIRIIRIIRN